jgi:hypothetical protein
MLLAPVAPLFEFNFSFHRFTVFLGPVVGPFALGTVEFYEAVLGHKDTNLRINTNLLITANELLRQLLNAKRLAENIQKGKLTCPLKSYQSSGLVFYLKFLPISHLAPYINLWL